MSLMRKSLEGEAAAAKNAELLMNDSQNNQSTQNDQVDVMLAKDAKVLAINPSKIGRASCRERV